MAVNVNWYVMDSKLGVNLNRIVTSQDYSSLSTTPEYPGPNHKLGDRVQGNNGSEWMYVYASATVTAFNALAINPVTFGASNLVEADVTATNAAFTYGIAQFQPNVTIGEANGGVANSGDYFWALIKANGGIKVNMGVATVAPAVFVGSNGRVTSAGNIRLVGVGVVAATANSAGEASMFTYMTPYSLTVPATA